MRALHASRSRKLVLHFCHFVVSSIIRGVDQTFSRCIITTCVHTHHLQSAHCSPGTPPPPPPPHSCCLPAGGWAGVWGHTVNKQCNQVGGNPLRFNKENKQIHTHTFPGIKCWAPAAGAVADRGGSRLNEGLFWAN